MRRFLLPVLLLMLAVVALLVNVPVFHATGSATYSFGLILLSLVSVLGAVGVAIWRVARG
jgi:uncharacterized membrane protein YdjX (TVP38/TMEM64 family)